MSHNYTSDPNEIDRIIQDFLDRVPECKSMVVPNHELGSIDPQQSDYFRECLARHLDQIDITEENGRKMLMNMFKIKCSIPTYLLVPSHLQRPEWRV